MPQAPGPLDEIISHGKFHKLDKLLNRKTALVEQPFKSSLGMATPSSTERGSCGLQMGSLVFAHESCSLAALDACWFIVVVPPIGAGKEPSRDYFER